MTIGITVLGSTGSIGINTLEVIALHPGRYHVEALSGYKNVELMFQQCTRHLPNRVVMVEHKAADELRFKLKYHRIFIEVLSGESCLSDISAESGEVVVCGIVGKAGLHSMLEAVSSGKKVLIANKESLVMLGQHIMDLADRNGACVLPIDSEHNAIFQCLPQRILSGQNSSNKFQIDSNVKKILLTGSGGPCRNIPLNEMDNINLEQACVHPNWKMGRKISIDSATMMNKGLELIEGCVLFRVNHQLIDIVIHPQSIIHSMVEYIDGSIIAQLCSPDMRVPIATALAWPERIVSGVNSLNFSKMMNLNFEPPDYKKFPALKLAREAAKKQGNLPAIMNAANEVAVEFFLQGRIKFNRIVGLVEEAMGKIEFLEEITLESIIDTDQKTRIYCKEFLLS